MAYAGVIAILDWAQAHSAAIIVVIVIAIVIADYYLRRRINKLDERFVK